MAKKRASGKHTTPRKNVQIPEDWYWVAKKRSVAERPVSLIYYLIELIKKDAEDAGMKDLPHVPWEMPD